MQTQPSENPDQSSKSASAADAPVTASSGAADAPASLPSAPEPTPAPPVATPPPVPAVPAASSESAALLPPEQAPRTPKKKRRGCLLAVAVAIVIAAVVVSLVVVGFYKLADVLSLGPSMLGEAAESRIHEEVVRDEGLGVLKKIAVIDVKGLIVSEARFDAASAKRICTELEAAHKDEDVVAVILDMNSPGGEVTASDEIHRTVQKVRAGGKPVVTCMHALGASGAYFVAAGTDHIVANRLTITGSLGVLIGTLNYARLFDKIGLESEIYKSGEMKDFLHGGRPRTQAERDFTNQLIQSTFRAFAQIIAEGRKRYPSLDDVLRAEFADGRILSGEQALELGLVDELGYFDEAVRQALRLARVPGGKVVRYRQVLRLSDIILSMQSRGFGPWGMLPPESRLIRPGQLYCVLPSVVP